MTGFEASGPILPRPRTAVGARGVVGGGFRIVADGEAGGGNTRRIGERQVALVAERLGRMDLQLARARIAVEEQRLLVEVARHRNPVISRFA